MKFLRRLVSFLVRWSGLLCVPGGLLWALSPVGVALSEAAFSTPNVFWKLFPSAPLLLLVGLVGLQLRQTGHLGGRSGLLGKVGFWLSVAGILLIVVGDAGLYWLGIDDVFLMAAPAYRAFRIGLLIFGMGCILFAVTAPRDGVLPTWGLVPFVVSSLCGLAAFATELGVSGSLLWMSFGLGWVWLGLAFAVAGFLSFRRNRRTAGGGAAAKG